MSMIRKCDKHAKATECEGELTGYIVAAIQCNEAGEVLLLAGGSIAVEKLVTFAGFTSEPFDVCGRGFVALGDHLTAAIAKPVRRKRGEAK